jgi:serine/threonine protein kinase
MPSKLGKYQLLKTLGQGAYSKVKLAKDTTSNKLYAIKVHKASDPNFNQKCVEVVETEAYAISKLNHKNIVNIVEYIPTAKVEKEDGTSYDVVCVIVEECAAGGELFFYVKNSGYFKEKFARYFFH